MIALLAHHVEAFHVPVLAAMFGVGCWVGWSLIGRLRPENKDARA
jgi:hypothetical protein